MFGPLLALCLVAAQPPAAAPAQNPYQAAVRAALADAQRIGPEALFTRYLSLPPSLRLPDLEEWKTGLDFWVNGLSREPVLVRLRRVGPTLLAANSVAYGWDLAVYDKLAEADPYYHVQVDLVVGKPGKMYFARTRDSKAGWYGVNVTKNLRVPALAPWAGPEHADLVALTNSPAPILRADWFFSQVSAQFNRKVGYYDLLGVKNRDDFHKLVGLNEKESERIKRQIKAIVRRSGVANFPRQVERLQSLTGGYYYTEDVITDNRDRRNALRQLDEDYQHQAEEHYGVLPNGLFAFFLSDDKGVRQDSAPDGIGPDKTAPGNDGKIHVGISCARCHVEGLRPIRDWGRRVFAGPVKLSSPDPVKYQRLVQLYLDDLQEWVDTDTDFYARRLRRLTGWKPDEAAKTVGRMWAWYVESDMLPADAAAELGLDEKVYLQRLRDYFAKNGLADQVLASHIQREPEPIRRDDWEELQPLVLPIVLGAPVP